tara:strand:+ start:7807 stop:8493 length:687 start_codon:yes stop_codon:yes gene_type:complete
MSAFNHKDNVLLVEAYELQLLKEQAPNMSINQIQNRLYSMTESELIYVNTVNQRILNEFWGGLKNLKNAAGNAVSAVGQGVKNAAVGVGQGVKNAAGNVANAAAAGAQGAVAAGKQVVDNTKDIINTGNVEVEAGKAITQAQTSMQQLIDLVTKAQQNGLIKAQGAITDMTLANIIDELTTAQQSAGTFKQNALDTGFTGGAGKAAAGTYAGARQAPAAQGAGQPAVA